MKNSKCGKLIVLKNVFFVAVLFLSVFLSGCAKQYSYRFVDQFQTFRKLQETVLNSPSISDGTQQTLRLLFLDEKYGHDSLYVFNELEKQFHKTHDPNVMIAISELSIIEARKYTRSEPRKAIALYLNASVYSKDFLFESSQLLAKTNLTPSFRFMVDVYNISISKIAEIVINEKLKIDGQVLTSEYQETSFKLGIQRTGEGLWDPRKFDFLQPANQIDAKGLKNTYITQGIGAPLVGLIDKPKEKGFGDYAPPGGLSFPVTAIVKFGEPVRAGEKIVRDAIFYCYDSLAVDSFELKGINIPLEVNYSTPLIVLLSKLQPQKTKLQNMLRSDEYSEFAGMYMLQPYDPNKIPLVMVHGLMSTTETWMEMFNDLFGDPDLRNNYQIWFFQYPTGLPIIYSASLLRKELLEIHSKYNADNSNENFNKMVLVGHSMGGLLSRLMVQDSGTTYWDTTYAEPFEEVGFDEESKKTLEDILFFDPLSFVKRVVFIATPHKGSPLADKWFTGIGSNMIRLPEKVTRFNKILSDKKIEITEEAKGSYTNRVHTSLELLSPSSQFIKSTNMIPLVDTIPYHSIIGTIYERSGPDSSDGVVPYESAHLDFSVSEKLVPENHSAHKHPLAIYEVKRILHRHLDETE